MDRNGEKKKNKQDFQFQSRSSSSDYMVEKSRYIGILKHKSRRKDYSNTIQPQRGE